MPVAAAHSAPTFAPATIANGAALSGGVAVTGALVGLNIPAAWTAADITFQGSCDNGATYTDIYDGATERKIPTASVVVSHFLALALTDWLAFTHIKVRSGTSAAPVNQGAQRVIQCAIAG